MEWLKEKDRLLQFLDYLNDDQEWLLDLPQKEEDYSDPADDMYDPDPPEDSWYYRFFYFPRYSCAEEEQYYRELNEWHYGGKDDRKDHRDYFQLLDDGELEI